MPASVITKKTAQRNLSLVWISFCLVLFLIFFGQTVVGNKYPGQSDEVWDWFLPSILPTLALMFGVLGTAALAPAASSPRISKSYYQLTMGVIIVYFLIFLSVVLTAPLAFINDEIPAFDHLKASTKPLSFLQGLVTLTLSIFFLKESK